MELPITQEVDRGEPTVASQVNALASGARRAWKRLIRLERQSAMAGPALFAVVAASLLVYNHLEKQVTDIAFWLGLALIGSVFIWMLENNRRAARLDHVTGLANRMQLHEDLAEVLASEGDRSTLVLLELDGLAGYQDSFGFEAAEEMLRRFAGELSGVVEQLGGTAYRVDGGQFCAVLPTGGRQPGEIVMAISASAESGDDETQIYRPHGEVTMPDEASDPEIALKLAGQRLAVHKQRQRRSAKRQAQDVLTGVLIARRPELEEHLRAVTFRTISIGRLLGLDQVQLDDVVSAARLQNIGLMAVPDSILDKPGSLTPAESEVIRDHTSAGAAIISSAPGLAPVATLVRSSCEHFDGGGYPDGLSGEAIPLGSRIVAVCVAYTALIAPRPYRQALTPDEALSVLRQGAGMQFDPRVVEALAEDLADEVSPSPESKVALLPV
jgi:HD-GYP domain-containing protein (c-di-GMP phosphodiesterase class II)